MSSQDVEYGSVPAAERNDADKKGGSGARSGIVGLAVVAVLAVVGVQIDRLAHAAHGHGERVAGPVLRGGSVL